GFLRIAVAVTTLYLLLTAVVVLSGLVHLAGHPELVDAWRAELHASDWGRAGVRADDPFTLWVVLAVAAAVPAMALGLSGFELSLASAPLVSGKPGDTNAHPRGRVANTRKMMLAAAVLMSLFVVGSLIVVPMLVPTGEIQQGDRVEHRALAYL